MKRTENQNKKSSSLLLKKNKLPINFNEIDINLLLSNPKVLHNLLNEDENERFNSHCVTTDEEDDPLGPGLMNLKRNKTTVIPFINGEKVPEEEKGYLKKPNSTKAGKLLNKGVSIIQDTAIAGYDKGKDLINDFINEIKEKGFKATVEGKGLDAIDFMENKGNDAKKFIMDFINKKEFDNVKDEIEKGKKRPRGKAMNDLMKRPAVKRGAELLRDEY